MNPGADLNRSATYYLTQRKYLPEILRNLIYHDGMDVRYPEAFIRIAWHPLGFRPPWANGQDLGVIHLYAVPAILEKEPQTLADSRLWC